VGRGTDSARVGAWQIPAMTATPNTCAILQRDFPPEELTPISAIRPKVAALIVRAHPQLHEDSLVSAAAIAPFRAEYVRNVLEEDLGALSTLEQEVVTSLREHEVLAENVDAQFETERTRGEHLADAIAEFGGSWRFICLFGGFLGIWILANAVLSLRAPDPYPFILLNLVLSCLAAIQAPVIMMSQNRQEAKDRARSEHDYKVNLKAELEIRHLHEKMDYLLKEQAQRLFALQELQIDLMEELGRRAAASGTGSQGRPPSVGNDRISSHST
jgi:uncharacterized membrane protein